MTQEYENLLRTIIILVLGSDDAIDYGISNERIDKWKEKREIEIKKYNSTPSENRLIYYSDFYDLKNIISKKWELFKPILIDKKRFEIFFEEVEKLRNTIAHGREIFSGQEKLLEGILDDLKRMVVMHHNQNLNQDDFFIKILKVADSLGNICEVEVNGHVKETGKILRVGDSIEFKIDAFDPKGRTINFVIYTNDGKIHSSLDGKITVVVTSSMIQRNYYFNIRAFTEEVNYENKDWCDMGYTILP